MRCVVCKGKPTTSGAEIAHTWHLDKKAVETVLNRHFEERWRDLCLKCLLGGLAITRGAQSFKREVIHQQERILFDRNRPRIGEVNPKLTLLEVLVLFMFLSSLATLIYTAYRSIFGGL